MKGEKKLNQANELKSLIYNSISNSKDELEIVYFKYFNFLKIAAYKGNPNAQYEFAQQFEDIGILSMNNPLFNPKKAFYWYQKAANNNVSEACNMLAHYFELGVGCQKDLIKAKFYYEKAASLGYKIAKKNLIIFKKQYPSL